MGFKWILDLRIIQSMKISHRLLPMINIVLYERCKTAIDLPLISDYESEEEVILLPFTRTNRFYVQGQSFLVHKT
jgi:hypothetical protein